MHIEDIAHLIAGSDWFQGVPREAILQLALSVNIKKYKKKSFLYSMDDVIEDIYFIVSGKIRISLTSPLQNQFYLNDFGPGKWMGEAGFISSDPQLINLQFKEAGEIFSLNCDTVHTLAKQYPIIYYNILKDHNDRTRGTYQILKSILFNPLKSRLAGRILYKLQNIDINPDGSAYLNIKVSQREFAHLTHGSRQHINKIFKKWNNEKIIVIKDNQYYIPDVERLKQEAYLLD
jgi:CRP-like cAMP-binding protein